MVLTIEFRENQGYSSKLENLYYKQCAERRKGNRWYTPSCVKIKKGWNGQIEIKIEKSD